MKPSQAGGVKRGLILLLAVVLFSWSIWAQGNLEAVNGVYSGGVISQYVVGYINGGTMGWVFSPTQDIAINNLGWLLAGVNPPAIPVVSIGLWSIDGTLLRSVLIGSSSVALNGSLYESVAPLLVTAGSTLVIAAGGSSGQSFSIVAPPSNLLQQPINFAGTASLFGSGFTFPTVYPAAANSDGLVPAATFLFQTVPEPSAFTLAALGGLLLAFRCWKN